MSTTVLEYWPSDDAPEQAIRWTVEWYRATAEVCTACVGYEAGGKVGVPFVASDGGAGDDQPLDGPWTPEFTVEIDGEGHARMWADDLQLGTADNTTGLVAVLAYLYRRGAQLLANAAEQEVRQRAQDITDARKRIADSLDRVARRRRG